MTDTPSAGPARPVGDLLRWLAEREDRPPLHAPGTHPLWTDPHIARGMLAAHLDPDRDEASRRPGTIDATVAWLAGRLPPGARVLDLGCGPGLYTERLAAAGFEVTGVDFSAGSIAYARSRGGGVRYLQGDYRTIPLAGTFDAVLLIYLDLASFAPADARHILGRVRGWLAPGGVFAADVPTPRHREGSERRRDWGTGVDGFWAGGPHAWLARTLRYADASVPTYLDEYLVITPEQQRVYRVWERCFTPGALRAEFAGAGLAVRSVHGDLAGAPYVEGSSTVLGVLAGAA